MSLVEEQMRQLADMGATMAISDGEPALIAHGPVATVYSVRRAGQATALKVFPGRIDRRMLAATEREQAKLRALVPVAPILPVDGVEQLDDGRHALRMELGNQSLADLVARVGPLPSHDVVVLGYALASALAAAHGVGILHGAMNPDNVLFRASGEPMLADFGVRLREAFPRDPLHGIEFVSPQTLRTGTIDERSDLYALGALLHLALTGSSPHPRQANERPGDRVLRVLGASIPAIDRADVPAGLSAVVASLLEADPAARSSDASWVAAQFADLLPRPTSTPPHTASLDDFDAAPGPMAGKHGEVFDDFGPSAPPPPDPGRQGTPAEAVGTATTRAGGPLREQPRPWRRWILAGGGVLAGLLIVAVMLLPQREPDQLRTVPRVPPPPVSTASPGSAVTAARLELADPIDLGNQVVLNWTSDRSLDFVVVVAGDGEPNRYLFARRNRTMTIPVDPVRKYCFLIQAADSNQVYETKPKAVRGAVCRH